jgi:hypothetical protein
MADSHRHLDITPQEWDAFLDDFAQTLDKFKPPALGTPRRSRGAPRQCDSFTGL